MKRTANGHNHSKFSLKESRADKSQPILEMFKLESWPTIFDDILDILVQVNNAVYDLMKKHLRVSLELFTE